MKRLKVQGEDKCTKYLGDEQKHSRRKMQGWTAWKRVLNLYLIYVLPRRPVKIQKQIGLKASSGNDEGAPSLGGSTPTSPALTALTIFEAETYSALPNNLFTFVTI